MRVLVPLYNSSVLNVHLWQPLTLRAYDSKDSVVQYFLMSGSHVLVTFTLLINLNEGNQFT